MKHFKFYTREDILSVTKIRRFETKIGERIKDIKSPGEWIEMLKQSDATYVLLGIPEDIGIKANCGIGGADTLWLPFLTSFLNIKAMIFFSVKTYCCWGILILATFNTS